MTTLVSDIEVQEGTLGKLVMARLKPNQDLTESVEALCEQHGMQAAIVRGAIGSLIDARLEYATPDGWREMEINGPGVEILNVFGEVGFQRQSFAGRGGRCGRQDLCRTIRARRQSVVHHDRDYLAGMDSETGAGTGQRLRAR